ncbi:aromatic prenyltransferase [Aspergillus candidus]|uniref:Aromatic prenyltransferase n=1 Tax=Aspergillus candidus TaxID=41067 RepID=A0A2I2EY12_ASPCN|nr:aromatic prenyltransferase [Aspergillus candidus]PLB33263.1 aromatic prenyltransferase [Aspergillus candidus]
MRPEQEPSIQAPTEKVALPMSDGDARPWQVLSLLLPFHSPDQKLWWDKVGPLIEIYLNCSGYNVGAQYRYLLMLHSIILPVLGPFPNHTKSNSPWPYFMNNGDPCDLSINYQGGSAPCVRIGIEPIGPMAGTNQDPMNEFAARRLLEDLSRIQTDIDFQLFDHFRDALVLSNHKARLCWDGIEEHGIKAQGHVALDLHEHSLKVKAYCVPLLRSLTSGVHYVRMMIDSIKTISRDHPITHGLSKVDEYLAATKHLLVDSRSCFSFDCADLKNSRYKIYVGANVKTLGEAYGFWTLGGSLKGEAIDRGFQLMEKVWKTMYAKSLPDMKPRKYIPFIWNWEVSPTDSDPIPKAYFQVLDDYDSLITEVITCVFGELGWTEHAMTHQIIQKKAYPGHDFGSSTQVYSWISLAYSQTKGPYITIYSNPAASL